MPPDDSRVWLITGCSSGFGLALAQAALARGDRVLATARDSSALDELVSGAPSGTALAVKLDVTDPADRAAAIALAGDRFGRLDVLVNNAGFGSVGAVEEIEEGPLRGLMETMFFGALSLTQAALPVMRRQGSGAIVQISSMGGQVTMPGFGAYCAAKFALEAVSESLAAEVASHGIRVLIVEPGAFRTGFGGAGMQRSPALGDVYAETVGPTRRAVDQHGRLAAWRSSEGRGDDPARARCRRCTAASCARDRCPGGDPGRAGSPPRRSGVLGALSRATAAG